MQSSNTPNEAFPYLVSTKSLQNTVLQESEVPDNQKIGALKDFDIFTGKHLRWSLFVRLLQAWRSATLLKGDSNTGVFLWILQNF